MPALHFLVSLAWLALIPSGGLEDAPRVRVRVLADDVITRAQLGSTDEELGVFDVEGGHRVATVRAGVEIRAEARGEVVRLRWQGGGALLRAVRIEGSSPNPLQLAVDDASRSYRGALELRVDDATSDARLIVINEVDVEAYVAAVLPSEYPFPEMEGAKAQAVAIRSYALGAARKFGALYDLTDNVSSQVYRGVDAETAISRRAAFETSGKVLLHDQALIEAVYSASNGGHTAANATVWQGTPAPYLVAKPDPFDQDDRYDSWSAELDARRLLEAISREVDTEASDLRVGETSPEGRVIALAVEGRPERSLPAGRFRSLANEIFGSNTVRSTFFTLERRGDRYLLEGRGYGHGVGLSQIGARNRARAGHSYDDILAFYFDGTSISTPPATERPPEWLAEAVTEAPGPPTDTPTDTTERAERRRDQRARSSPDEQAPRTRFNRPGERRVGW